MDYLFLKRTVDILVSGLLLILLAPLLMLVTVLIKIEDWGPVFFLQERAGFQGRIFSIYKFRTMYVNPDRNHDREIRDGDSEVTRVGRWLRRFKIDELPQLYNVLRGDVSLVGPRPALPRDTENYTPFQSRRLEIKGGLTGLAQVNGNTFLTWPERIIYDVEYVDTVSLKLDLVIILKTLLVVLLGEERFLKRPAAGGE